MSHVPSLSMLPSAPGAARNGDATKRAGLRARRCNVAVLGLASYLGVRSARQAASDRRRLGARLSRAFVTAAYRRFILSGRGAGLRAQIIMLGLASLAFAPLLAYGSNVGGALAPIGVSLLVGAFIFGVGMQLAGGCASGTLYTVGGGGTRMLIVLAAFIAGSYRHLAFRRVGGPAIPCGHLAYRTLTAGGLRRRPFLVALYGLTLLIERQRHGTVEGPAALRHRRLIS
jgi:uncharacterized membrane protein YedE/YeeE